MPPRPFHLSFAVPDLAAAHRFYTGVLGCQTGRVTDTWIDVLFHGNQLTLHQAADGSIPCPLDHFGVILSLSGWREQAERIRRANYPFMIEPVVRDAGELSESGKFVLADVAGNQIEIKYYRNVADEFGADLNEGGG